MKVYFAGMEQVDFASVASKLADIHYGLFSVWYNIAEQFGYTPVKIGGSKESNSIAKYLFKDFKHLIMDSGLFTLMFGAASDGGKTKKDFAFMERWQKALVEWVVQNKYPGTVVECDIQKVCGVDAAWNLRRKLRDQLQNEQLNVFHIEDGKDGLKKLVDFSNYIAISVPEWRRLNTAHPVEKHIMAVARDIKRMKPSIKIHLLGCTQKNILEKMAFCDSCDSTSWQQVNRYGWGKFNINGKNFMVNRKYIETKVDNFVQEVEKLRLSRPEVFCGNSQYYANYAMMGIELKRYYSSLCGEQS